MPLVPEAVERLAAEFGRLPGIGPKTAQRLTFFCLRAPAEVAGRLAGALTDLHAAVRPCEQCFFIAGARLCAVCSDPRRDPALLCVVEDPLDGLAIERSGEFHGLYHVLGGALSPMDGEVREVVIATDPDVEGEATAYYVGERLASYPVTVSRLAHGLPAGTDLEYADELTVARAFTGRRSL